MAKAVVTIDGIRYKLLPENRLHVGNTVGGGIRLLDEDLDIVPHDAEGYVVLEPGKNYVTHIPSTSAGSSYRYRRPSRDVLSSDSEGETAGADSAPKVTSGERKGLVKERSRKNIVPKEDRDRDKDRHKEGEKDKERKRGRSHTVSVVIPPAGAATGFPSPPLSASSTSASSVTTPITPRGDSSEHLLLSSFLSFG